MTTFALHLPTAAENAARAQSVATDPNNVANLIQQIKNVAPAGTPMNVISAAAVSGAVHAADFPPQGATLHIDSTTGQVAVAPLGTPAPAVLPGAAASTSMLSPTTKPIIGAVVGGAGGFFLARRSPLFGGLGALAGYFVGSKL